MEWVVEQIRFVATTIGNLWSGTPGPVQTIITAAFGTLIGAALTSRAQAKRRVIEELRAIHAAYTICFATVNKAMTLKRQHIRPMKAAYDDVVAEYDEWMENQEGPLNLELDLRTPSKVRFADAALERTVFEKSSLGHLGLAAALSLEDATNDLNLSIEYRNDIISRFQEPPETHQARIELYVGAYRDDKVDLRFANNIEALSHQADDCIFFGMVLAQELLKLERKLWRRKWWKYRLGVPRQHPADWTLARSENLVPDRDSYASWLRGFRDVPSRWKRLVMWFKQMRADTRKYMSDRAIHDAQ